MRIEMPSGVKYIIEQLKTSGYEAYAVGGCVRDSILGRKPNDWDITTSAKPEDVKSIFRRTIDTGIQHGTVTVMLKDEAYEITTYRIDGEYSDHRRPDGVTFTSELSEDLLRRDFTINAMAYNDEDGLVDLYGGLQDLDNKIIRCVGDPDERFDEDALRIMRAVRFAAQLGFEIDSETKAAAAGHAKELNEVSAERIETELTKLITSDHPEKIMEMYELGITAVILPEFDEMVMTEQNSPYHLYDVGRHTVEVMKNTSPTKVMRYTALLHDSGKVDKKTTDEAGVDHFKGHAFVSEKKARVILKRLRMDNDTIRDVSTLCLWHDFGINGASKKAVRRMLSQMGPQYFDQLVEIKKADMLGQSDYLLEDRQQRFDQLVQYHEEIVRDKDPLSIAELKINGKDLIDMGIKPGPKMGEILQELLDSVLENPSMNKKETLIEYVSKRLKE